MLSKNFIRILSRGGTVLYPTDTIYGLGCDALQPLAVEKIRRLKGREPDKPFLVLAGGLGSILQNFRLEPEERHFLERHCPGPFTLLLKPKNEKLMDLRGPGGRVGLRWADSPFLHNLFQEWDGLLLSTSANISGERYLHDENKLEKFWKEKVDMLALHKSCGGGKASALLRFNREGGWSEIRRGPITLDSLEDFR